jgi:hypothetical protein
MQSQSETKAATGWLSCFRTRPERRACPRLLVGRPGYALATPSIPDGREARTLSLSWDGADDVAHTPKDTIALIDPTNLRRLSRPAYIILLVLRRETDV